MRPNDATFSLHEPSIEFGDPFGFRMLLDTTDIAWRFLGTVSVSISRAISYLGICRDGTDGTRSTCWIETMAQSGFRTDTQRGAPSSRGIIDSVGHGLRIFARHAGQVSKLVSRERL